MKTPEQVFNQIAAGELLCPCALQCSNAQQLKRLPRPDDAYDSSLMPKHESYEDLIGCVTDYTRRLIYERIKALRSHAVQNLKLPFETFRIFSADTDEDLKISSGIKLAFRKAVLDYKLQFSSNVIELSNRIEANLFSICESVISQTRAK